MATATAAEEFFAEYQGLLLESLENRYAHAEYFPSKLQFVSVNCKRCTIFSVQIIFLFVRSLNINASTSDLGFLCI